MPRKYNKRTGRWSPDDLRHRLRAQNGSENEEEGQQLVINPDRSSQRPRVDDSWRTNLRDQLPIFGEAQSHQSVCPAPSKSNNSQARARERSTTRASSRTRARSSIRGLSETKSRSKSRGRSKTRGPSKSRGLSNGIHSRTKDPPSRSITRGSSSKRSPSLKRNFINTIGQSSETSQSRKGSPFRSLDSPHGQNRDRTLRDFGDVPSSGSRRVVLSRTSPEYVHDAENTSFEDENIRKPDLRTILNKKKTSSSTPSPSSDVAILEERRVTHRKESDSEEDKEVDYHIIHSPASVIDEHIPNSDSGYPSTNEHKAKSPYSYPYGALSHESFDHRLNLPKDRHYFESKQHDLSKSRDYKPEKEKVSRERSYTPRQDSETARERYEYQDDRRSEHYDRRTPVGKVESFDDDVNLSHNPEEDKYNRNYDREERHERNDYKRGNERQGMRNSQNRLFEKDVKNMEIDVQDQNRDQIINHEEANRYQNEDRNRLVRGNHREGSYQRDEISNQNQHERLSSRNYNNGVYHGSNHSTINRVRDGRNLNRDHLDNKRIPLNEESRYDYDDKKIPIPEDCRDHSFVDEHQRNIRWDHHNNQRIPQTGHHEPAYNEDGSRFARHEYDRSPQRVDSDCVDDYHNGRPILAESNNYKYVSPAQSSTYEHSSTQANPTDHTKSRASSRTSNKIKQHDTRWDNHEVGHDDYERGQMVYERSLNDHENTHFSDESRHNDDKDQHSFHNVKTHKHPDDGQNLHEDRQYHHEDSYNHHSIRQNHHGDQQNHQRDRQNHQRDRQNHQDLIQNPHDHIQNPHDHIQNPHDQIQNHKDYYQNSQYDSQNYHDDSQNYHTDSLNHYDSRQNHNNDKGNIHDNRLIKYDNTDKISFQNPSFDQNRKISNPVRSHPEQVVGPRRDEGKIGNQYNNHRNPHEQYDSNHGRDQNGVSYAHNQHPNVIHENDGCIPFTAELSNDSIAQIDPNRDQYRGEYAGTRQPNEHRHDNQIVPPVARYEISSDNSGERTDYVRNHLGSAPPQVRDQRDSAAIRPDQERNRTNSLRNNPEIQTGRNQPADHSSEGYSRESTSNRWLPLRYNVPHPAREQEEGQPRKCTRSRSPKKDSRTKSPDSDKRSPNYQSCPVRHEQYPSSSVPRHHQRSRSPVPTSRRSPVLKSRKSQSRSPSRSRRSPSRSRRSPSRSRRSQSRSKRSPLRSRRSSSKSRRLPVSSSKRSADEKSFHSSKRKKSSSPKSRKYSRRRSSESDTRRSRQQRNSQNSRPSTRGISGSRENSPSVEEIINIGGVAKAQESKQTQPAKGISTCAQPIPQTFPFPPPFHPSINATLNSNSVNGYQMSNIQPTNASATPSHNLNPMNTVSFPIRSNPLTLMSVNAPNDVNVSTPAPPAINISTPCTSGSGYQHASNSHQLSYTIPTANTDHLSGHQQNASTVHTSQRPSDGRGYTVDNIFKEVEGEGTSEKSNTVPPKLASGFVDKKVNLEKKPLVKVESNNDVVKIKQESNMTFIPEVLKGKLLSLVTPGGVPPKNSIEVNKGQEIKAEAGTSRYRFGMLEINPPPRYDPKPQPEKIKGKLYDPVSDFSEEELSSVEDSEPEDSAPPDNKLYPKQPTLTVSANKKKEGPIKIKLHCQESDKVSRSLPSQNQSETLVNFFMDQARKGNKPIDEAKAISLREQLKKIGFKDETDLKHFLEKNNITKFEDTRSCLKDRYEQIRGKINADDAENIIEWTVKFLFKPKKLALPQPVKAALKEPVSINSRNDASTETGEAVIFGKKIPSSGSRSTATKVEAVTFGKRIPNEPSRSSETNKADLNQINNPMPLGSQNQNVPQPLFPAYSQPAGSAVQHAAYPTYQSNPGTSNGYKGQAPQQGVQQPDGGGYYSQLLPAKSFKKMIKTFGNPSDFYARFQGMLIMKKKFTEKILLIDKTLQSRPGRAESIALAAIELLARTTWSMERLMSKWKESMNDNGKSFKQCIDEKFKKIAECELGELKYRSIMNFTVSYFRDLYKSA